MLGSLRDACGTSHLNHPLCCPISDEWYQCIHNSSSSSDGSGAAVDYAAARSALDTCLSRNTQQIQQQQQKRQVVAPILAVAKAAVGGTYTGFPGPMCSPFRKTSAEMLQPSAAYTFTEKSDGLRVLVVSLNVAAFPQWSYTAAAAPGATIVFDVYDTLCLEVARGELLANSGSAEAGDVEVTLKGTKYRVSCSGDAATASTLMLRSHVEGEASITVSRCVTSRCFNYMIDRSLDAAYLCMDIHTTGGYEQAVFDGELMTSTTTTADDTTTNSSSRNILIGFFDVFLYKKHADPEATHLTRYTMSQRYEALQQLVAGVARPAVHGREKVQWFAKTMWPVAQLGECLSRMTYADGCYWYDGPYGRSRNDGFVFTPELFDVVGGASAVQLKWKWRSLLSVDLLISPSIKFKTEFDVFVFFRKMNYSYREDSVGHWKCQRTMKLLNPHKLKFEPGKRVVAECVYADSKGLWSIERIRSDKPEANSIVTIVSVFESLVEHMSLAVLCDILDIHDAPTRALCKALEPSTTEAITATAPPVNHNNNNNNHNNKGPNNKFVKKDHPLAPVVLSLRAIATGTGGHRLTVSWCTNNGNPAIKNSIPCGLCDVSACTGTLPNQPGHFSLEEYLSILLANAGGSYAWSDLVVEAYFNGSTGRWVITQCRPKRNPSEFHFDQVLSHLQWFLDHKVTDVHRVLPQLHNTQQQTAVNNGDGGAVAAPVMCAQTAYTNQHYAEKARQHHSSAEESRSVLRLFNNWVKSMMTEEAQSRLKETFASSPSPAGGSAADTQQQQRRLNVLDICCGRGGDLHKWKALSPAFLYMTDASVGCVAEAALRYATGKGMSTKIQSNRNEPGFPAHFGVHDAFDPNSNLSGDLAASSKARGGAPFHLASCQFSMHYGCFAAERMEYFISTIAASLSVGGIFMGTTVDDAQLAARYGAEGASFGNAHYGIRFPPESVDKIEHHNGWGSFGLKYYATVEDTVTDLPEFVVPWALFTQMCLKHSLHLIEDTNFKSYYEKHQDTERGKAVMETITSKRSRDGELPFLSMSDGVWAAVSVYKVFVLEKR